MRIGFIGLGNMGAALAAGIMNSWALPAGSIVLANRSSARAEALASRYPGARVAAGNADAASGDLVFVAVRTDQLMGVLQEISPSPAHVVVVNGGLPLERLEGICGGPVSKLIPSVTMEWGRGVSLVCHGSSVPKGREEALEGLIGRCSQVVRLPEGKLDAAADLTSCGPALLAEMADQLARAGVRHGGLDPVQARHMVLETLMGTALALTDGRMSVEGLRSSVATKGGITEEGLRVLEDRLPAVLDEVMERTLAKHQLVRSRLQNG